MIKKVCSVLTVTLFASVLLIFGALHVILPDTDVSSSERRHLASFPSLTYDSFYSGIFMDNLQKYLPDQFPFRETFRTIKANFEKITGQLDSNNIYSVDGYLSSFDYDFNQKSVEKAGEKLERVRMILNENGNAYIAVIPHKGYYMNDGIHPTLDFELMCKILYENTPNFNPIDISSSLSLESYYKTDSHWRQEKLFPTVKKLTESMNIESASTTDYIPHEVDGFYGVYAGQSALGCKSETLIYLTCEVIDSAEVTYIAVDKKGVYDQDAIDGKTVDMYDVYLGGAVPIVILENTVAETERELIIIRDSFGSSITPLMLEYYSKITAVDLRYISSEFMTQFIDSENADILVLLSPGVIGQSEMLKVK